MALEIKRIMKTDGRTVVSVISPGTIYQLFKHIKKTNKAYDKWQRLLSNAPKTDNGVTVLSPEVQEARADWDNKVKFVQLIRD